MMNEIIFPVGIIARNNMTDEKFVLKESIKGHKENDNCYRLVNSHWVYVRDNPNFKF